VISGNGHIKAQRSDQRLELLNPAKRCIHVRAAEISKQDRIEYVSRHLANQVQREAWVLPCWLNRVPEAVVLFGIQ
jgi:hypothetical protein